MYVTLFVVGLIAVIMFHEFGHFATAKAFGMKCEKFFLGFGPTLWSFHKGETEYGVKAIPAGGFVKITGMSKYEEIEPEDAGRTFHEKPAWQRTIVLAAGSFTHFVVAAALMLIAFAIVGFPNAAATNVVDSVAEGTPAAEAGIAEGDRIVAVDGVATADFEAVRDAVVSRGGQTVPVTVERDGTTADITVAIAAENPAGERAGFLGVGPRAEQLPPERMGPGEAVAEVFGVGPTLVDGEPVLVDGEPMRRLSLWNFTRDTMVGLGQALTPSALMDWFRSVPADTPRSAEGPMSLVGVGQAFSALGASGNIFTILLLFTSLNIVFGVLNMLPLPPLDGGHLAVLLTEEGVNRGRRLMGKPGGWTIDPAALTPVALAVILFFVVVSLTALYVDIVNPASELFR